MLMSFFINYIETFMAQCLQCFFFKEGNQIARFLQVFLIAVKYALKKDGESTYEERDTYLFCLFLLLICNVSIRTYDFI